ncbi:hypothetical protein [Burkholderia sp. LMG 32019]|uniref:hypothetical protein n=1 Tax=Burkholderia sp. LMG 32019 TaxID=3158173 RepID=UPI003C2F66EB
MEPIIHHSVSRAADEAIKLWALASAQYPKRHSLILNVATASIIEAVSAFSLNARRALEVLPQGQKFGLAQPRWQWTPTTDGEIVADLWDALNRIIHAQKLDVGFEELPKNIGVLAEGSLVVPYVRAATDRRKLAFIDPFALSHAFLYGAFPHIVDIKNRPSSPSDH